MAFTQFRFTTLDNGFQNVVNQRPVSEDCRGDMRLEAATGEDHSEEADIMVRDSIKGRALRFIKYLENVNPEGRWGQFLTPKKRRYYFGRESF